MTIFSIGFTRLICLWNICKYKWYNAIITEDALSIRTISKLGGYAILRWTIKWTRLALRVCARAYFWGILLLRVTTGLGADVGQHLLWFFPTMLWKVTSVFLKQESFSSWGRHQGENDLHVRLRPVSMRSGNNNKHCIVQPGKNERSKNAISCLSSWIHYSTSQRGMHKST